MRHICGIVFLFLLMGCVSPASQTLSVNEGPPLGDSMKKDTPPVNTNENPPALTETPPPFSEWISPEEKYWNERVEAAFAPVDCPDPPVVEYPDSYYKGLLFDNHIHMASIPDGGPGSELEESSSLLFGVNTSVPEYVCTLTYDNTYRAVAFFPVWEPIVEQHIEIVKRTVEKYPDFFVPFAMVPDSDGSPDGSPTVNAEKLDQFLSQFPGLFRGYGEIGLYARPGGAPDLPPNSPRLKEIYPVIRKHDLVVYFHLGEGHQAAFEEVLSENHDITFIFHGDQLIGQGPDNTQDLSAIDEILSHHSNVYYEVDELWGDVWLLKPGSTKENFLAHFKDYEPLLQKDVDTWKKFIEKHPDQVIWGSDRGASTLWDLDREVALVWHDYVRAFIGKLDPSVQEKYAYKNAERIFGQNKETN